MKQFAVLQLSGCAGCEVSLLNADAWIEQFQLVYMPLVVSAYDVPAVDVLLVSGGVRSDEDLHNLRRAVPRAGEGVAGGILVAVGTCAISGGVAHLGDRDEVRQIFLAHAERHHVPRMLPKSHPIDAFVKVDRYLPGCPPTPRLFMALLEQDPNFKPAKTVCQDCGRRKLKELRPQHLLGFQQGEVDEEICLINQGYLCIGSSTRGGCGAPCTRAGHPCVGCRGPSDTFIEKESSAWFSSIEKVFAAMTDIPPEEVAAGLRSPQMALFLFQFSDYGLGTAGLGTAHGEGQPRAKEKVL